jgi:hypothetical protein
MGSAKGTRAETIARKVGRPNLEQTRRSRRIDALLKATSGDYLLREQFVTDPAQIIAEYVKGASLPPDEAAVRDQLIYAVASNPGLVKWLSSYSIEPGEDQSSQAFFSDFGRAVIEHGGHHVVYALIKASAQLPSASVTDELFAETLLGLFGRRRIFESGTEMSGGTQMSTGTGGTQMSTGAGIFAGGTEMSTGNGGTEMSTGNGGTEMSTGNGGTEMSTGNGGIFAGGTEMSTGGGGTQMSTGTGGTEMSTGGGIFAGGTEMSTGGGTEMSTGTGGTEMSTGGGIFAGGTEMSTGGTQMSTGGGGTLMSTGTRLSELRPEFSALQALISYATQLRDAGALELTLMD